MDVLAIVVAHNEQAAIAATLAGLEQAFPGAAVIVADDGSTDATATVARAAGAEVISVPYGGKGGAATEAARRALERGGAGAVYVFCDGDLGASAANLAPLAQAAAARGALAVAAFARRDGGGFGLAVGAARLLLRRPAGRALAAPLSGQRALAGELLERVLPFAPRFGMEVGMTIDAVRAGGRVVELELDLAHRSTGRTPGGFAHRARQLADLLAAWWARR